MSKILSFLTPDTKIVSYMLYPRFLMDLDLSEAAKLIYMFLLDRARLSMKDGWTDENGNVYILYTLKNLASDSGKSLATVKAALNALEKENLIFRDNQKVGKSRKIYVKTWLNFQPRMGQKTGYPVDRKLATIKNNINKNNIDKYSFEEGESL